MVAKYLLALQSATSLNSTLVIALALRRPVAPFIRSTIQWLYKVSTIACSRRSSHQSQVVGQSRQVRSFIYWRTVMVILFLLSKYSIGEYSANLWNHSGIFATHAYAPSGNIYHSRACVLPLTAIRTSNLEKVYDYFAILDDEVRGGPHRPRPNSCSIAATGERTRYGSSGHHESA